MNQSNLPYCIECKQNRVIVEINDKYVRLELFCAKCRANLPPGEDKCIDCDTSFPKDDRRIRCIPCLHKRMFKAEQQGLCTLCFANPQSRIINKGGELSTMCIDCIDKWTRMNIIHKINDKLFRWDRLGKGL